MSDFANDREFRQAVAGVMDRLLDQVDDLESDDHDPRLTTGNLAVSFDSDGSTFVLSQQTPTHEIWLSANLTAWHFVRRDGVWLERDSGQPMLDVLGELFTDKLGFPVEFEL